MSFNLSRAGRSDSAGNKKASRSGSFDQQRSSVGVSSKGGVGAASSITSNHSGQKHNINASMGRRLTVNADSNVPPLAVQNGAKQGQSINGSSVAPGARQTDAPTQNPIPTPSSNVTPTVPHSIISAAISEAKPPTTPAKSSSNTPKSIPLQFGSISPGFMNGMQLPARTSSAPPNLDEQKKDQPHRDSSSAVPITTPSLPLPEKDTGFLNQSTTGEAQSGPKSRKEPQVSVTPSVAQTHKPSVLSVPGLHMQVPFHQQHVSAQFGGHKPQIQPQPMPGGGSLPMSMAIPMPIPLQQQSMFVPGFQPHHMHSQGMIHQGQTLNFPPQIGPMFPHLGNVGVNMVQQFPQQQGGNYNIPRKTVKITHPDTHEELRLDDSPSPRPHSVMTTQSQAVPSFPPNYTVGFFPNSYSAASVYHPAVGSVPGANVTHTSQPQRFHNQVVVKPPVVLETPSVVKAESTKPPLVHVEEPGHPLKETEVSSSLPQESLYLDTSSVSRTSVNLEIDNLNISTAASADTNIYSSTPIISSDKNLGNQDKQDQIDLQSTSISSFPSQSLEGKTVEGKSSLSESISTPESVEGSTSVVLASELSTLSEDAAIVSKSLKQEQFSKDNSSRSLMLESFDHASRTEECSNNEVQATSVALSEEFSRKVASHTEDSEIIETCTSVNAPDFVPSPEDAMKYENEGNDNKNCGSASSSSVVFDKGVSGVVPRGKKKKKDLYRKAEAAGRSSDIYVAYKGPEEKKDAVHSMEDAEINSNAGKKQPTDLPQEITPAHEVLAQSKIEPDDWEDAAEIPTPKIETSKRENTGNDGDIGSTPRLSYSRDFLLTFSDHVDLPDNFEVAAEIVNILSNVHFSHEQFPSPGRNADRPTGGPRLDRRGSASREGDDISGFGINQIGNHGVLRNPRAPYARSPQGNLQRNNSDAEKWVRGTGFEKGLMPSLTPFQVMHKTEKKYMVGKVTDEEEAKQRRLKSILNKLTPENFQRLFEQVKQVNIDNVVTLSGVITQIFDKALTEPTFCEMYANFCLHLAAELPELNVDGETVTFKRLLLTKCQEEFEKEEMEENAANKDEEEGEREEKRLRARRRMLGNIRLIGELYKKKMLTERIMNECIGKLLCDTQTPDEENIEALCKLMSTIGERIDHPKAKKIMDYYFEIMSRLSDDSNLSSRIRFLLQDVIDLRKNRWQARRKVEGPKMIDDVHKDAVKELQGPGNRPGRATSFGGSGRRPMAMEYSPRGPNKILSPSARKGGYRAASPQPRGSQNVRTEELHSSLPMRQRSIRDEPIILGPQGGLARGMASRGQPSAPSGSLAEQSYVYVKKGEPSLNGVNSTSSRSSYAPIDRTSAPSSYDQSYLQDKSMNTIKEYYSVRDKNEVALCIKDLNTPLFLPTMISLWINDSFERKGIERDLLTKLLISLIQPQNRVITEDHLIKGFEFVLANLEDTVNDAPRAAEFLGQIFAPLISEKVISLSEIGSLIRESGEDPGSLVETGLGFDVLKSTFDTIKSEKGDLAFDEICSTSNLQLESFRPQKNQS